ncbi:MAG: DNA methyltransferase [Armatimonadota bacterium]|nr:DNA methyltransferase [Armatimonadota bacterium]
METSHRARRMENLPLNQILLGDCVQVMNNLPERSVDIIFADPPYNLQIHQELYRPNMTLVDGVDDDWDRFQSLAEYDQFTEAWLLAARRVLKDTGTLWVIGTYHNIYRIGKILMDLGFWILNDVVWIKTNPMPQFRGVRFANAHETLIWAQKVRGAKYTFNYHQMKALNDDLQMRSDWYIPICTGRERIRINGEKAHSTQKPEALLYRVILSSTNVGDIVLDPFFGTGTTGAVAKRLHRRWIGIERDARYVAVAQERINQVVPTQIDAVQTTATPPHKTRKIPFGALVEQGYLLPGEPLFFQAKRELQAIVLANGHIKMGKDEGSIHQIGRLITGSPCNGWEHWYFFDRQEQRMIPIDDLRKRCVRNTLEGEHPHSPESQIAQGLLVQAE